MDMLKVRLKEVAEKQGKTVSDLSYDARISRTTVYEYWRGTKRQVSFDVLERFAKALNVPALSLLVETDDKIPV